MLAAATLTLAALLQLSRGASAEGLQTVALTKLSKLQHGTELVLIEKNSDQTAYQLEDFFWTGSGDGGDETSGNWGSEGPVTEYKTRTVVSTVYIEAPSTHVNQSLPVETTNCPFNCEAPSTTPAEEINPTPTLVSDEGSGNADRQFWLVTVLKSEGKNIIITDLKNSLARLYQIAFQRQQEHHLGISGGRSKRAAQEKVAKPVNVYIHNVAKSPINGKEKIEVLYHVSVSGQPVAATTAAADMHWVSDEEVTNELGYPFIIKAEPYLKISEPQYLASSNNTWVFIGVALTILFVLLLLVALLTLAFSKHSKSQTTSPKKPTFPQEVDKPYIFPERRRDSSTYINFKSQPLDPQTAMGKPSSSSSLNTSSLDTSPLVSTRKKHPTPRRPHVQRPKAALNKTTPLESKNNLILDSDSSIDTRRDSSETILIRNYDPGVVSPKSYLSMPSVKSFPRGNIPEPLNKILEPVSVLHLDTLEDDFLKSKGLIRHASLNTIEDPGVIGPVVWNSYCKKLHHGSSFDDKLDDMKVASNASRMRRRFHDLLDETFSLFGSRRDSPVEEGRPISHEVKSHSALTNRPEEASQLNMKPRPKTSCPRKPAQESLPPRGAWATNSPSPLPRPLSAGQLQRPGATPELDMERILAEGTLPPNDPAIPLIAAIKAELGQCSLPGSTTNLTE